MLIMLSVCCFTAVSAEQTGDAQQKELPQYTQIAQSDLGVIGGYTLSEYIESKQQLDSVVSKDNKPANAIFNINKNLEAVDKNNAAFCTVQEALLALDGKILPTFRISDEETCAALCEYLSANTVKDVFIMSEKDELVKRARQTYVMCRGVLDFTAELKDKTSVTQDELLAIRGRTNACLASVAVIPDALASTENVKYLYDRLIAVWVCAVNSVNTPAEAFYIAAAGGHGAITDNTALMYDVIENYMSGKKLFRVPLNIGHRGIPAEAPENTIEGSIKAYKIGADCIENDVYLTKDGQIAVMHDGDTSRTTNGNLSMEGSTLAELKELIVNKQYPNKKEYADARIPSLEDYYKEFKGKDVQIFVELKSNKKELVEKFYELTEAYGMTGQVSVITFYQSQITNLYNTFPEMSAGLLCGAYGSSADSTAQVISTLATTQKLGSTYNPSFPNHSADFAANANMRGLTSWPWTVDDNNTYIDLFMRGFNGITSNNCRIPAKWAKKLSADTYAIELFYGDKYTVSAKAKTYNRKINDVSAKVRVIPLTDGITVGEGNVLSFPEESGVYCYALEYTYKINSAYSYTLYTQPVTVKVSDPSATEPVTTDEQEQTTDTVTENNTENNNTNTVWIIVAAIAAAVIICAAAAIIIKNKKR